MKAKPEVTPKSSSVRVGDQPGATGIPDTAPFAGIDPDRSQL
jgi:hypothetical protein